MHLLKKGKIERVMRLKIRGTLLFVAGLLVFPAEAALKLSQHNVIPVLLRRCVMCHGQDAKEAGLDLRSKASMLTGKAFVSGKPEESKMIQRIVSRQCPPDNTISMAGI